MNVGERKVVSMRTSDSNASEMKRREFLVQSAAGAALILASESGAPAAGEEVRERKEMSAKDFRDKLLQCLGGAWPEPCELKPELRETIRKDGYRIESLFYEVEPGDRVPAMLLVPDGVDANHPAPAVAIWHQHNGEWHLGKTEPAGLAGNPMHHTGVALVREGYVVLCPDALCFEERQSPDLKAGNYERFEFLRYVVAGKCMAWKNILDMRRGGRLLVPAAGGGQEPDRLLRPLDGLDAHVARRSVGAAAEMPGRQLLLADLRRHPSDASLALLSELRSRTVPIRRHAGHCGPDRARALHLNFGELDGGSPIQEVREGVQRIARAYQQAGAAENFSYFIEDGAEHVLSPEMWRRTQEWFARHLKPRA